ncbi:MAG: hypothetical protein K2L60_11140 [Bacteroides sp.]|nr:hypothetical protein [Bacteroides sp.]
MNKRIFHLLFLLCLTAGTTAQKRNINDDWSFVRLTRTQQVGEIRNQGSDWSSQYNVEHVSMAANELRIPADTLKSEFSALTTKEWDNVRLPHTPFVEELTVLHQWQGICYYKKRLKVSRQEAAGRLWLEFEGAMHLADVWVNGKHLMQHAGGYTPFVVDVSGRLNPDTENEVLENLDFCYYGGLYRDVNLIAKPAVHITHPILSERRASGGIFVTYPQVGESMAQVSVQTEVENQAEKVENIILRHTLFEWNRKGGKGRKVQTGAQEVNLRAGEKEEVVQMLTECRWWCMVPNLM